MTDEEFEKKVTEMRAQGIELDSPVKQHDGYEFGTRIRIICDDEDRSLYEGDEGVLLPEQVGAKEYGNLQTKLYFLCDGMESQDEVQPDDFELIV